MENVKNIFKYENGELFWKFKPASNIDIFKPAGCINIKGYRQIRYKGKQYFAHRLVWFYHYGKWPEHELDHINRDKLDNRLENLRDVSHADNIRNKENYVGCHKDRSSWKATVTESNRRINLGHFKTREEALEARRQYGKKATKLS